MKDYLIAERYARGLSVSVSDDAELDSLLEALKDMAEAYAESHDLRSVLSNPAIDVNRRVEVLDRVAAELGTPPQVLRLVELLVRRGRITVLADVVKVFREIADHRLNRATVDVTSAAPLDETQQSRIKTVLQKYVDKEMRLACRVDKALLGGVSARVGDQVFDGSLRTRLKHMKSMLLAEG